MQGNVLAWHEIDGHGVISGDDGARYSFSVMNLKQIRTIRPGMRVDFVPEPEGIAGEIYFLGSARTGGFDEDADTPSALFDLPKNHPSLKFGLNPFAFFGKGIQLYFDGRGRATIAEFWSFQLIGALGAFVFLLFISATTAASFGSPELMVRAIMFFLTATLMFLFIPSTTILIRRLHDFGFSGWWVLLVFVPYIGWLALLIIGIMPSQIGPNQYGPYYSDQLRKRASNGGY